MVTVKSITEKAQVQTKDVSKWKIFDMPSPVAVVSHFPYHVSIALHPWSPSLSHRPSSALVDWRCSNKTVARRWAHTFRLTACDTKSTNSMDPQIDRQAQPSTPSSLRSQFGRQLAHLKGRLWPELQKYSRDPLKWKDTESWYCSVNLMSICCLIVWWFGLSESRQDWDHQHPVSFVSDCVMVNASDELGLDWRVGLQELFVR